MSLGTFCLIQLPRKFAPRCHARLQNQAVNGISSFLPGHVRQALLPAVSLAFQKQYKAAGSVGKYCFLLDILLKGVSLPG